MEEPSKAWPSSNLLSSTALTGTPTCCSLPRVSVKRRSTNLMPCSLISFRTSAAVLDILESPRKLKTKVSKANRLNGTGRKEQKLCHRRISNQASIVPYLSGNGGRRNAQKQGRKESLR